MSKMGGMYDFQSDKLGGEIRILFKTLEARDSENDTRDTTPSQLTILNIGIPTDFNANEMRIKLPGVTATSQKEAMQQADIKKQELLSIFKRMTFPPEVIDASIERTPNAASPEYYGVGLHVRDQENGHYGMIRTLLAEGYMSEQQYREAFATMMDYYEPHLPTAAQKLHEAEWDSSKEAVPAELTTPQRTFLQRFGISDKTAAAAIERP